MGPGQHLHRPGQLGVPRHLPMQVAVGPDQVGQDPGVAGVGLGPGGPVAVAVPVDRQRVHRVHRVARGHQGPDQQAPVELDADHDVGGILGVRGDHLVQPGYPFDTVGDPPRGEHPTRCVHDARVVVALCPVDPHEDHVPSFPLDDDLEPGGVRGALMDQCSMARHPTSRRLLASRGGTI